MLRLTSVLTRMLNDSSTRSAFHSSYNVNEPPQEEESNALNLDSSSINSNSLVSGAGDDDNNDNDNENGDHDETGDNSLSNTTRNNRSATNRDDVSDGGEYDGPQCSMSTGMHFSVLRNVCFGIFVKINRWVSIIQSEL